MSEPTRHDVAAKPATDAETRSRRVLARSALKLGLLGVAAAAQWLAGLGFMAPLAALASLSSMLDIALGVIGHERVDAPHFVYFDEAVWFFMLSYLLRLAS